MRAGHNAHFAMNRPQILVIATIDPLLSIQNADPKRFLLHIVEGLRDRERIGLRISFQDRHLHFFAQCLDRFSARDLSFGVKCRFNPIAGYAISDLQQVGVHREQRHLAFRLSYPRGKLFLNPDHLPCLTLRKLKRLHKVFLRNFFGRAFDHDDVVLSGDVN